MSRRLWVIAHFDSRGRVSAYVHTMLQAYRRAGGELMVVSTARLDANAEAALRGSADTVLLRDNAGLDFASWRCGLALRDFARDYDEVIVANDSVFGPFADITPIVARLSDPSVHLLGLTFSHEVAPHLQSYFLGFNLRVFPRDLFESFWSEVEALTDKEDVIRRYEVGLSQRVLGAGIPLTAVFDMRKPPEPRAILRSWWRQVIPERADWGTFRTLHGAQRSRQHNPTMYHWHEMLAAGVPYVKVALLRDNPIGVRRGPIWRAIASHGIRFHDEARSHLGFNA